MSVGGSCLTSEVGVCENEALMQPWVAQVPAADSVGVELPGCVRCIDHTVKLLGRYCR